MQLASLSLPAPRRSLDLTDAATLLVVVACWYLTLVLRTDLYPIQPWDESRNAVIAHNMLRGQGLLVAMYDGAPDHWQEKPPLLYWLIAGFGYIGLPFRLALRLPSFLAVLGTALTLWAVCRIRFRDRLAGIFAPLLLLSSALFLGDHVGRTGDTDALLSLVSLAALVTFWASVYGPGPLNVQWFWAFGAAVAVALMTKGVGGLLIPAGLSLSAAFTGRLRKVIANRGAWTVAALATLPVLAYLVARCWLDPGYLQAVWRNQVTFVVTSLDRSSAPPSYYLRLLLSGYMPGLLALPAAALAAFDRDENRRSLARVCVITGMFVLLVISVARTKHWWYVAPAIPILALPSAMGLASLCRAAARSWPGVPRSAVPGFVITLLMVGVGFVLYRNQRTDIYRGMWLMNGQFHYEELFSGIERSRPEREVVVLDSGMTYSNAERGFNPALRFAADQAGERGFRIDIVDDDVLAEPGRVTATCDQLYVPKLLAQPALEVVFRNRWCVAGLASTHARNVNAATP